MEHIFSLTNARIFQDTEEMSRSIKHTNVRAIQTSAGLFRATLAQRCLADWSIQHVAFDAGRTACAGDTSRDRYSFVVPIRHAPGARLLGREVVANSLAVYAPGSEHADSATAGYMKAIAIPPPGFVSHVVAHGNGAALPGGGAHHIEAPEQTISALRVLLEEIGRLEPDAEAHDEIGRSLLDALTLQLAAVLDVPSDGNRQGRPNRPRSEILRQITDLMESRQDEPIYATELANAAGISQPTLQRAFLDLFGVPPARYLLLKRLHLARTRLRSGEYESVSEAASSCGFWELSRFSKRYRAMFGEVPSETLRAARQRR